MGISERMGDVLGLAVESKLMREIAEHPVSVKHLAIIMDGNRRFAWKSNVATGIGHRIGKEKLEKVLDWVLDVKIPWLTVYALSTENLNRPQEELDVLFKLYVEGLHDIADAADAVDLAHALAQLHEREGPAQGFARSCCSAANSAARASSIVAAAVHAGRGRSRGRGAASARWGQDGRNRACQRPRRGCSARPVPPLRF